jgi:hypothetical protein
MKENECWCRWFACGEPLLVCFSIDDHLIWSIIYVLISTLVLIIVLKRWL